MSQGLSIDQWLATVAGWKPKMSVSVNVADLGQLISDHIAVRAKLEAIENWACENVAGDELRAILWPTKSGRDQSAERLAERHGFSYCELTQLLGHEPTTWRAR